MARRTPTLLHRGYLYAQERVAPDIRVKPEITTRRRMRLAAAWKAGYMAAQNDAKRKKC